jgi:hypothetical protein
VRRRQGSWLTSGSSQPPGKPVIRYIAQERGYQRGWAGHKFKEKFGAWLSWRYAEPLPPDDAVRS